MPYQRDTLYDTPQAVVDFRFDERTAAVFPDMIHRSVPGYATLLQLFAVIGAGFVREGGHVYDLGCALGGASIALQRHIPPTATIDAVDNAEAMTRRLAAYVEGAGIRNIRVQQADITALDYRPADLIIMAFTLQFIPPEARDALLVRLRQTRRVAARRKNPPGGRPPAPVARILQSIARLLTNGDRAKTRIAGAGHANRPRRHHRNPPATSGLHPHRTLLPRPAILRLGSERLNTANAVGWGLPHRLGTSQ